MHRSDCLHFCHPAGAQVLAEHVAVGWAKQVYIVEFSIKPTRKHFTPEWRQIGVFKNGVNIFYISVRVDSSNSQQFLGGDAAELVV